jgi:RNA 3'-terminal phosphate cyclase (ATP)
MNKSRIEIDGAQGEGGGQMLRTSLALSLLTGKAFHLHNVRAKRAKPGLAAQHLMSVHAAAKIGKAKVRGAHLGSCDLDFEPGNVEAGDYCFKIGTAGATSLVLHTIYLPLALADAVSYVTIEGGTHVKTSPNYSFLERAWVRYLSTIGLQVHPQMERAGFYPRGGGRIHAAIQPCYRILPFQGLTTPAITQAHIVAGNAGLPPHIAERMIARATERLAELGLNVECEQQSWLGGPGCMLGIELPTEPAPTFFFALGERGKPAETVADEAAAQVAAYVQVQPLGVDEHSADQLLLPLAFAEGPSRFRVANISSHLRTNADVIQHFLDREIRCDAPQGEPGMVTIS